MKKVLGETKVNLMIRVDQAIPLLSDEELVRLADQTKKIERDIAGAGVSKNIVWVIILAIAVILLITAIRQANDVSRASQISISEAVV